MPKKSKVKKTVQKKPVSKSANKEPKVWKSFYWVPDLNVSAKDLTDDDLITEFGLTKTNELYASYSEAQDRAAELIGNNSAVRTVPILSIKVQVVSEAQLSFKNL